MLRLNSKSFMKIYMCNLHLVGWLSQRFQHANSWEYNFDLFILSWTFFLLCAVASVACCVHLSFVAFSCNGLFILALMATVCWPPPPTHTLPPNIIYRSFLWDRLVSGGDCMSKSQRAQWCPQPKWDVHPRGSHFLSNTYNIFLEFQIYSKTSQHIEQV